MTMLSGRGEYHIVSDVCSQCHQVYTRFDICIICTKLNEVGSAYALPVQSEIRLPGPPEIG